MTKARPSAPTATLLLPESQATATRLLESIADMCIFTDMMQMQDIDSDAETDTTEYAFAYIHSDADANANINTGRNANTSLLD